MKLRAENRSRSSSRLAPLLLLLLLLAAGLAYQTRGSWLPAIGEFLVQADQPEQAEIIVVLAGDGYGDRIMKAVELAAEGFAPKILVDGPTEFYGVSEADLAIPFAVSRGASRRIFDPFPMEATSTMEESQLVDEELRRRGVAKALVVTSNFHTRRARSIFRKHGSGEVDYVFIAAPNRDFRPEDWWLSREGRKTVLLEYLKTLNSLLE